MTATASTPTLLRVLLVDGSAADAELVLAELRRAGFAPVCQRVETEREYVANLVSDVDVILADDQVPRCGWLRALALANERGLRVPFIIVSSTSGEDSAVAAIKLGASDYLRKDRLARLGPAVRQAIDATALARASAKAERAARRGDSRKAAMLDAVRDGIFLIDDAHTVTELNPAAERMFGLTRTEAIGRAIGELFEPAKIGGVSGIPLRVTLAAAALPGDRLEMMARRADGSAFPVELTLSRLPAPADAQVAGVFRDVSDRSSHEAAGLERQRQSAFAQDVGVAFIACRTLDSMLNLCAQLMVTHLDAAMARVWTKTLETDSLEFLAGAGRGVADNGLGLPPILFFPLDDVIRERRTIVTNAVIGDPRIDQQWAAAHGIVSFVGFPLMVGERVVGVIALFGRRQFTDATIHSLSYIAYGIASAIERERIEGSQARLAAIVEATTDLVSIGTLDDSGGRYLNHAGRAMLGVGPEERAPDLATFRAEACITEWDEVIVPAAIRDGLWSGETTFVSRDGRRMPVSLVTIARARPDGKMELSSIARDITDRQRIEEELRRTDERIRFAHASAGIGIWELEIATRRAIWSDTLFTMHGMAPTATPPSRETYLSMVHPDDRAAIAHAIASLSASGGDVSAEYRVVWADGTIHWLDVRSQAVRGSDGRSPSLIGVVLDITERKRLETQLRQSQKMDAIGQLAGGVAHDFNNLLTAILGYSRLVIDDLPAGDSRRPDMEEVIKAAHRAEALTQQLLAFSRTQVLRTTSVDLNELITSVSGMLRPLIGEHIELELVLAPELALVRADAGQIEQIVINMAVNARDAMETGGRVTLETANVHLDATSGLPLQTVVPGWYVMLAVIDRGAGMDEHTKRRLFEPFFTTKERGKGTGLGLATVYGIVKQSDGYIWVESEPGCGSTFRVYLPRTARDVDVVASPVLPASPRGGSETVLLVEDEAGVRALASRILREAGYRVLEAAQAQDAVLIFAQQAGAVDLLISDVIMPGTNGPALFRRLAAEQSRLKVIFISGYATEAMARQVQLDRTHPFVQKPFTAAQLISRVRRVLDGDRSAIPKESP